MHIIFWVQIMSTLLDFNYIPKDCRDLVFLAGGALGGRGQASVWINRAVATHQPLQMWIVMMIGSRIQYYLFISFSKYCFYFILFINMTTN